jgi:hypothetical protein
MIGLGLGLSIGSGGSGAAEPFTPADLDDLIVWCESDTLVQAGTVSSWTNQADGANPLIVALGAGFRPTYTASDADFGGEPSVVFSQGTPNWLHTTNDVSLGAFTIVHVCKHTTSNGYIHHQTDGSDANYCRQDGTTVSAIRLPLASGKNSTATWAVDAGAMTLVHRYGGTHAGHILRVNGADLSLNNGVSTDDPGTGAVVAKVGLMAQANSATPSSGKVAAFFVVNRALTDPEVLSLEAYLQDKYGHY